MARRTPGVPDFESLRAPKNRPHLLLNAVEFAVRTREDKGASYDINTGEFLEGGKQDTYVIGGEPDTEGTKIPEERVPGRGVSVGEAATHIEKVRQATGMRPDALAGSWYEPKKDQTVLDASRAFEVKDEANAVGHQRGEREGWGNKQETTWKIRKPRGKKS